MFFILFGYRQIKSYEGRSLELSLDRGTYFLWVYVNKGDLKDL